MPGISERLYTDDWLKEQDRKETQTREWQGKQLNLYEQTQQQRKMETAMRAQRTKVDLLKKSGADPDDIMLARAKYQAQLDEYSRFSKKMGLVEQRERIYQDMRGRVATNTKKENARYTPEMMRNAKRDSKQYERYREVLKEDVGSLADFRQMKYNDPEKWKIIEEAYGDINWQRKALKNHTKGEVHSAPYQATPNSVFDNYKDGIIQRRRFYGSDGKPRLDIDMTDHGNSKEHPVVPHYHNWHKTEDGALKRESKHDNELKLGHKIANKDILGGD